MCCECLLKLFATGKAWKPKEEDKVQVNDDVQIETEWDEVLASATEAELVDLAGNNELEFLILIMQLWTLDEHGFSSCIFLLVNFAFNTILLKWSVIEMPIVEDNDIINE